MSSTSTQAVNEVEQRPTRVVAVQDRTEVVPPVTDDAKFQAIARGDRDGTLKLRGIPTFTDPYAKRKWMKEHMAVAFRFFGKQGYGEGASGHISMRGTSHFPSIARA